MLPVFLVRLTGQEIIDKGKKNMVTSLSPLGIKE